VPTLLLKVAIVDLPDDLSAFEGTLTNTGHLTYFLNGNISF
jgi:hypothetical protein